MGKSVNVYKDGKVAGTIPVGICLSSKLSGFEKVEIPEKTGLILFGDPNDKNAVAFYYNETYAVDAKIDRFQRAAVLDLENVDLRLLSLRDGGLSDGELLAVVGGTGDGEYDDPGDPVGSCKVNTCGAEACGAQL